VTTALQLRDFSISFPSLNTCLSELFVVEVKLIRSYSKWTAFYHSGIGGGGFALVRTPNGTFEFVDFREVAPAAAFENMFDGNSLGSKIGGLAR
jgi:hypothetical protein